MKYHMDTHSLISVANYLGFLEGTGRMEIDEEDQLYGIMEQIDEDVNKHVNLLWIRDSTFGLR